MYKNLAKNRKTSCLRQAIQEPAFCVANTEFKGGDDGRGCGDHTFLVIHDQSSHNFVLIIILIGVS
jgi:hypothetical protein